MSDLEIIKELEKELGIQFKQTDNVWAEKNSYVIEYKDVTAINLIENNLQKIPENLLKLKNLQRVNLSYNAISDIIPLLELEHLENIALQNNKGEISSDSLSSYLSKAEKLKTFNFFGSYNAPFLDKKLLNHNFLLGSDHFKDGEKVVYFDNYQYFPPLSLLELGYNNPKFYYDNYNEQWERIINEKKSIVINKIGGDAFKHQIISDLLNKYYRSFKLKKELPYAIRKLLIRYYQGIDNLFIDDISVDESTKEICDPQWIFLTGENGYGKTSLLQSIAIGLFGSEDHDQILNKRSTIYLELKASNGYRVNSSERGFDNVIPVNNFAAYGPARLNKSPRPLNENKTYSLFNTNGILFDIEEKLMAWEKDPNQEKYYKSARKIMLNLLSPQIEDIIIIREGTKTGVKYIESKEKNQKFFHELASGYRTIIAMIGDIIIRLSENQPEINDFTELAGIVLIDEIDLHLHPKWQKALVEKLTETFPKIQFIASTHSPIPLLGAPANSVVINVQRDEEKGITAEKLDIDFSTLTPNSILSSPIFGFEDLVAKSKSKDEFLNTEDAYKDIEAKTERRKQIAKYLSPDKTEEFLKLLNDDGK